MWGDVEDEIPHTQPEDGIKSITEVRIKDNGQQEKITKKIRTYKNVRKVNKQVEERKKRWKKFGVCAGFDGPEPGITGQAKEEVFLVLGAEERKQKQRAEEEKKERAQVESMYRSLILQSRPTSIPTAGGAASGGPVSAGPALYRHPHLSGRVPSAPTNKATTAAPNSEVYIPPRLRGKGLPGASGYEEPSIEETSRIHVTNLSEDVTEFDLRDRFGEFGSINRVYVVKDKDTGMSKGSAFITFNTRGAAQAAMEVLNGSGWMNLIMNIEWARPSGGPRM